MSTCQTKAVGGGGGGAGDERKLVTVMFADISGFTALSTRMDPEDVRGLMNRCFDALVPSIDRYGGTIDKFIGDEIMAIFGAPVAFENHAERALRAALEMQESLERFNAAERSQLEMHVGVNTGTVLAGGVGSAGRRQYSVMGDAVNLAARLKEAAGVGTILAGPATFRLCAPLFEFEAKEPMSVKGRPDPITAYRLLGLLADAPRRGAAGFSSPLVGRQVELLTLRGAVDALSAGTGSVVSIVGDPGLGKSRLVSELRRSVESQVRWFEGRALSHTERVNYGIARELLFGLLGGDGEQPPQDLSPAALPYLRRLAGRPNDPEDELELGALQPDALQRRMHQAFSDLVAACCRRGPVVLAWEDLHWADPSSLRLLESLLPLCDRAPILVLLAFRAGEGRLAEWLGRVRMESGTSHRVVALNPLRPDESDLLIEHLLSIDALPQATRDAILAKAEGNPFFLEELLRSLVMDGSSERLEVPDTLNGVIAARIDRLPVDDKRVLQTASVFGRIFARPALSGLLAEDGATIALAPSLVELERRELVRRHTDAEHIFKHALTHEVAYGGLLKSRRRQLHEMAARIVAALFPEAIDERSAELGFHYERAEMHDKAATFLAAAGDRARRTFSSTEAIAFYRAALEELRMAPESEVPAMEQRSRTAGLHEKLADVYTQIGHQDEARRSLREADAVLESNDRIGRSRLIRKEGASWVAERRPADAVMAFDRADAALAFSNDDDDAAARHEWIENQLERGWANYWLGQAGAITADAVRLGPLVERNGTAAQRASFLRNLVLAAFRNDRYVVSDRTLAHARSGVEAATASHQPMILAHTIFMLGFCHLWRDEHADAVSTLNQALRLAERIGDAERVVLCLSYLVVVHRKRGDLPLAREGVERSLKAATDANMHAYVALARANQAWLGWRDQDFAAAKLHGLAALRGWGQLSFPGRGFALWPLAGTAVAEGRPAEAIEHVRAMLATDQMRYPAELESELERVIRSWDAGDRNDATARLNSAIVIAARHGYL